MSIWTASQNKRLEKDKVKRGVEPGLHRETTVSMNVQDHEVSIHPFISHSDLMMKLHKMLVVRQADAESQKSQRQESSSPRTSHTSQLSDPLDTQENNGHPGAGEKQAKITEQARKEEIYLLDDLLASALDMESRGRRLLINKFDYGSKPRLLLQADKNLMERAQALLASPNGQDPKDKQRCNDEDSDLTDLEEIQ